MESFLIRTRAYSQTFATPIRNPLRFFLIDGWRRIHPHNFAQAPTHRPSVYFVSVRRTINIQKKDRARVNSSRSIFLHICRACAKRLHAHLFCYFFCEVFFFLFDTFTSFETNEACYFDFCAVCFAYLFKVFSYWLFTIFSFNVNLF